jgi:hypothetical protein
MSFGQRILITRGLFFSLGMTQLQSIYAGDENTLRATIPKPGHS